MSLNLDALLDPSSVRLAMGELTTQELEVAREAATVALSALHANGWSVQEAEATPGLLMSIAVRLDHGLGMAGYYDELSSMGLPRSGTQTHEERLKDTLDLAAAAHTALLAIPVEGPLYQMIDRVAEDVVGEIAPRTENEILIARAAVRYVITHLSGAGMAPLPLVPFEAHIEAVVKVLRDHKVEAGLPASLTEEQMRPLWLSDARRIHEEVSGQGFYQGARPKTPRR